MQVVPPAPVLSVPKDLLVHDELLGIKLQNFNSSLCSVSVFS